MDWPFWQYAVLAGLGVLASIINILAGGGSNLILPLLMAFGVPPDIANGTNRVGIFFQSLTGIRGFRRAGALPTADLRGILLLTAFGGLAGSGLASVLPNTILKPALLLCILGVATLTFLKPQLLMPSADAEPHKTSETRGASALLFAVGVYGGFVQASTAFILLPVLAGVLRYGLLQANALKLVCTLAFTIVALAVFMMQGQIWWDVGLVFAATLRVLMVAWMNAEALQKTAETGYAHYYSRSRQKQWMKGEESGHTQKVRELRLDCDGDAVVMLIEQGGGIACHTGRESCFYRVWENGAWQTVDAVLKDEKDIYKT